MSGTVRVLAAFAVVAVFGRAPGALDSDGDGIPDVTDNCPYAANPEQIDADGDGIGNQCDVCVRVADPDQDDADDDGTGDACDTCPDTEPDVPRPDESLTFGVDLSGCAVSDRCPCFTRLPLGVRWRSHRAYVGCVRRRARVLERLGAIDRAARNATIAAARDSICGQRFRQATDQDGDGVREDGDESRVAGDLPCANRVRTVCDDNCPNVFNPLQADRDGDGRGDACDPSNDGDPVPDGDDNCPGTANADQADIDDDGVGDACDACEETEAEVDVDDTGCSDEQIEAAAGS